MPSIRRSTIHRPLLAALLAAAAPLPAQEAGQVAVGVGFGLGTRTGPVVTVHTTTASDAGILCRVGGFIRATALSCGVTLDFSGQQFAVAELGVWTGRERPAGGPPRGIPSNRLFATIGFGVRGDQDAGDLRPVYDVGATFFFARTVLEEGGWTGFRPDAGWGTSIDLRVERVVNADETVTID